MCVSSQVVPRIQSYDYLGRPGGLVCSSGGTFTTPVGNGPVYLRDLRGGGGVAAGGVEAAEAAAAVAGRRP